MDLLIFAAPVVTALWVLGFIYVAHWTGN